MPTAGSLSERERWAVLRGCELAARAAGTVLPNPVVGCVLLGPDGSVVGEGFHERAGGPHAEVVALSDAGDAARGATAIVTLEPCDHTGRTGPCSEALIAAGVARVVVAVRDPWPTAAGGIARLRAAGIEVVELTDEPAAADLVSAAEDVNRVFLTAVRRARPFVTIKVAATIDGRIAAADGTSQWITSEQARAEVHELRERVDGIAVGIGTVLADDPRLTTRRPDGTLATRQPLRIVVDSAGRSPATARVRDADARTLIATVAQFGADERGRVDLAALLRHLGEQGLRHLLVEGGPRLAAGFLDAALADEIVLYQAPLVLGAGLAAVDGGTVATLTAAHRADLREVRRVGPDVMLRYRLLPEGGGSVL